MNKERMLQLLSWMSWLQPVRGWGMPIGPLKPLKHMKGLESNRDPILIML